MAQIPCALTNAAEELSRLVLGAPLALDAELSHSVLVNTRMKPSTPSGMDKGPVMVCGHFPSPQSFRGKLCSLEEWAGLPPSPHTFTTNQPYFKAGHNQERMDKQTDKP